jgi:hypothetical protein
MEKPMRTDRANNPIAAAMFRNDPNEFTKALDKAGIPWEVGEKFPGDSQMHTIKILGDGIEGARAILIHSHALQNWYLNHTGKKILAQYGVRSNKQFANSIKEVQDAIIKGIYLAEGGNGSFYNRPILYGGFRSALEYLKAILRALQRPTNDPRRKMLERTKERLEKNEVV